MKRSYLLIAALVTCFYGFPAKQAHGTEAQPEQNAVVSETPVYASEPVSLPEIPKPRALDMIPTPSADISHHMQGNLSPAVYKKLNSDIVYYANLGTAAKIAEILTKGADPNTKSKEGWPAISLAASRNDREGNGIVQTLVEAGADMNVRDPKGETPIMNAITNNNLNLVRYLIEKGADFRAVNTAGRSVLAFAEYYGNQEIIHLIQETIRLEEEQIREGKSRRRFYRILDDFIFYHCVRQYVSYNQQTELYRGEQKNRAEELSDLAVAKIINAAVELSQNFRLPQSYTDSIAENTHKMIAQELENLVSNRNRRKLGVGSITDIDKRCTNILNAWRSNFSNYEPTEPVSSTNTLPSPAP